MAFLVRGIAYAGKGQYIRAIQDYDEAIRLDPKYAEAFYNRGIAKRHSGDVTGGNADTARAKQLNPHL
jgi:tetratricopeptide (TPR) repeat protein